MRMLIYPARSIRPRGFSRACKRFRRLKPALGSLIISVAICGIAIATASARDILGFRLLALGGTPVHWSGEGTGPVGITYAFVEHAARLPGARNCQGMVPLDALLARSKISLAVFRTEVRAAFSMWEQAANIRFRETNDMLAAGILIGAQALPDGWAFADVAQRPARSGKIERSLICLNPDRLWKVGFDANLDVFDIRYTLAHEIGHAIGLDHPEATDQLMSHHYREQFRALQPGDIDGAVQLYGAKRSGQPSLARLDTARPEEPSQSRAPALH